MYGVSSCVFRGAHDVKKHFSSSNHIAVISSRSTSTQLRAYGFGESREAKGAEGEAAAASSASWSTRH